MKNSHHPVATRAIHTWLSGAILLLSMSCSGGEVKIVEPPPPPQTGVNLTVIADPEDAANAQQLGWASGIPAAEIRITPEDSSTASQSFTTGSAGTVNLGAISVGRYIIEVRRVLNPVEMAKTGTGTGVTGFIARQTVAIGATSATIVVPTPASRRRSLVINEVAWRVGYAGGLSYRNGGYFELYNNADTTVYLDGIAIGLPFDLEIAITTVSCQQSESMREDPAGVWVKDHQIFPGKGRDYPLQPGQIVTVAQDAIDHGPFYAGMPDLRRADFEFAGLADVDNPTVPNMIDKSFDPTDGSGLVMKSDGGPLLFLALPVNLDALPRMNDPRGNGRRWWRYPASAVLDVFAGRSKESYGFTFCAQVIHPNFDRQHGIFRTTDDKTDFLFSPARKVIGMTADGRRILQHSRHSAADFVRGPVTPLRLF